MYDIFYIGDNNTLKERLPFANQVNNIDEIKSNTKLYWLVDSNTKITDWELFDFKPDVHTEKYVHVWKWNQENYGGVSLLPKGGSEETVWHNKVVCKKHFDILFENTPGNYFKQNPYSTHVWCVDKDYILNDDIDWAPGNFEPDYIHSFHLRGQLEHKYPELEGGVKLYPREWSSAETKYHKFLDANVTYPILYVEDVNDMQQRDILEDDYVWLIDKEHSINVKTVDWVPNAFEYNYVHVFKMPYQLKEKYPMAMGGIRLVPKDWKQAEIKIHPACPVEDEAYDAIKKRLKKRLKEDIEKNKQKKELGPEDSTDSPNDTIIRQASEYNRGVKKLIKFESKIKRRFYNIKQNQGLVSDKLDI